MYHKQLVNHVSTRLQAGMLEHAIRNELVSDGWTKDDIEEAFLYARSPDKLRHFSLARMFRSEVPAFITIGLLILAVLIIGGFSYAYGNKKANYTINVPGNSPDNRVRFSYGVQDALTDPDFFGRVKKQFMNDKADFIEADLSAMVLRVYKAGSLTLEVPIDSKGREGSWWETPAGLYEVETKEKDHFSGMGRVWMPWSMKFQGNFYIHGRPYYPDGTLTSTSYTGGCIRLSTENSKKVYDSIDVGTPVLVFEHSFSPDSFSYKDSAGISLAAPIYISADLRNNYVFTSKESTKEVPIASITKLMTALIATEYINLDNIATVQKEAMVFTSKARLTAGSKYSIYQLLFPLLMESSNEAAETIARFYGRTAFIQRMNDKAASIGMTHTRFADPSGASADNISTAEDLFMLAKYIYNNRSFIFNITSGKVTNSAYGSDGFGDLGNFNDFVDSESFFGGKNGKTLAAGETNLSVFEFPVNSTKRPVVTIVLGSQNAKSDSEKLISYTLDNFK